MSPKRFRDFLSAADSVLAVLAPTQEDVERAGAVLADFQVQHLRYYRPLAVTDL
jgi:hypothetical protein